MGLQVKPAPAAKRQAGQKGRAETGSILLSSDDDAEVQPSAGLRGGRKLPGSLFGSNAKSQPGKSQSLFGRSQR